MSDKKTKQQQSSLWRLAVALAKARLVDVIRSYDSKSKKEKKSEVISQDPEVFTPFEGSNDRFWTRFNSDRLEGGGIIYDSTGQNTLMAWGTNTTQTNGSTMVQVTHEIAEHHRDKPVERTPITPKQALGELGRLPTHFSLEGLDDKISMFEAKRDAITQKYAKDDVERMLECLHNRKKYDTPMANGKTPREVFSLFDTTTQDMIDALCSRHQLVMKEADIFIPELPAEAAKTMDAYGKAVKEITGKPPKFYVIATSGNFKSEDAVAQKKRDPILLAPSPFGFFYNILGAWDQEMLYLPEL